MKNVIKFMVLMCL